MRLRPWLNSQHEMFDVMHSRATDRRSASKCQGKWPDQTLDEALGLPEVLVAVSSLRLSCKRAGKTRTLSRFGIHLENLGLRLAETRSLCPRRGARRACEIQDGSWQYQYITTERSWCTHEYY